MQKTGQVRAGHRVISDLYPPLYVIETAKDEEKMQQHILRKELLRIF